MEGDAVEGAVVCVSREEVTQALNESRKNPRTFTRVDRCMGSKHSGSNLQKEG